MPCKVACCQCCIFINSACDYGGGDDDFDTENLVFVATNERVQLQCAALECEVSEM